MAVIWGGVVVLFFAAQKNMHDLMIRRKQKRIDNVGRQIEEVLDELGDCFEKTSFEKLQSLKSIYSEVKYLHEWPFDTATLVKLLAACSSPALSFLLPYLSKWLK